MFEGESFILDLIGDIIDIELFNKYDFTGMVDHTGKVLYVSQQHRNLTGFDPHDVVGQCLSDRINPVDMPYIHEQHQKMIQTRKPIESKFEIMNKKGIYIVQRCLAIPQFNSDEFCGSIMLAKPRTVDINLFRKTRIMGDLRIVI
jgi:PAS domain S-box-containing protein